MGKSAHETWREVKVEIPPKSTKEIVFPDTKPNYFYVVNPSSSEIFLGISNLPNATNFDRQIGGGSSVMYARALGSTRCYLYNNSGDTCLVTLTTFEDEFNPVALNQTGSSSRGSSSGGGTFDGSITGFTCSLPMGNNHIGKVTVTEMPPISVAFDRPIPAGSNLIGMVDIRNMGSLPSGTNSIGKVEVTNFPEFSVDLTGSSINVNDVGIKPDQTYTSITLNSTTESYTRTFTSPFSRMVFLVNESAQTLSLLINGGEIIYLKEGESLSDLNFKISSLTMTCSGGVKARYMLTM